MARTDPENSATKGRRLFVADPGLMAREAAARAAGGQRIGDIKPQCLKPPRG